MCDLTLHCPGLHGPWSQSRQCTDPGLLFACHIFITCSAQHSLRSSTFVSVRRVLLYSRWALPARVYQVLIISTLATCAVVPGKLKHTSGVEIRTPNLNLQQYNVDLFDYGGGKHVPGQLRDSESFA